MADDLALQVHLVTALSVSPESGSVTATADGGKASTVADPALPVIPGFEVQERIGEGAMGEVYRARQVRLNRVVALKMVHGERRVGPKDVIRFLAEAESVASVPLVSEAKIGAQPGGSMITARVMNAVVNSSITAPGPARSRCGGRPTRARCELGKRWSVVRRRR